MNIFKTVAPALAAAAFLGLAATPAVAATYNAIQDTYVYEFLGNQGAGTGDSGGLAIWNHETNHGAQALIGFDNSLLNDAAILSGDYTATLNLFAYDTIGGFIGAVPDAANPVTTDIFLQENSWSQSGAVAWGDVSSSGTPYASLTQDSSQGWFSVDITSLVEYWVTTGNTDFGIALSQEQYGVTRNGSGSLVVAQFCDSESSPAACSAGQFSPSITVEASAVPVPAAAWLFGSALLGLAGVGRRRG